VNGVKHHKCTLRNCCSWGHTRSIWDKILKANQVLSWWENSHYKVQWSVKGVCQQGIINSFLSDFGDVEETLYTERNCKNISSTMEILSVAGKKTSVEWTLTIMSCMSFIDKYPSTWLSIPTHQHNVWLCQYAWTLCFGSFYYKKCFSRSSKKPLYTVKYTHFMVDENVKLIWGWSKAIDPNHFSMAHIQKKKIETTGTLPRATALVTEASCDRGIGNRGEWNRSMSNRGEWRNRSMANSGKCNGIDNQSISKSCLCFTAYVPFLYKLLFNLNKECLDNKIVNAIMINALTTHANVWW